MGAQQTQITLRALRELVRQVGIKFMTFLGLLVFVMRSLIIVSFGLLFVVGIFMQILGG